MLVLVPALSLLWPHSSSKCDAFAALVPMICTRVTRKTSPVPLSPPSVFSVRPKQTSSFLVFQRASVQQIYTYPDPIPEFAVAETSKFRSELLKRLSKYKDLGGDINVVVDVCAEAWWLGSFSSTHPSIHPNMMSFCGVLCKNTFN